MENIYIPFEIIIIIIIIRITNYTQCNRKEEKLKKSLKYMYKMDKYNNSDTRL